MIIKRLLILAFIMLPISINAFNLFRCNKDGSYTLLGEHKGSFDNAIEATGYTPSQTYAYYSDSNEESDILFVGFKNLSEDIVCVLTQNHIKQLTKQDVNAFLKTSGFDYNDEYGAYSRESDLDDAILNGDYTIAFICDALDISYDSYKNATSIEDKRNGYRYYFDNGKMIKWESLDGLNTWAKEIKNRNPSAYYAVYNSAKAYWGNDEKSIINEVNAQFDSFAHLPFDDEDNLADYYQEPNGICNFRLLISAHYNKPLTLREFKDFSHNKCKYIKSSEYSGNKKVHIYQYLNTLYSFDDEGNFIIAKLMK